MYTLMIGRDWAGEAPSEWEAVNLATEVAKEKKATVDIYQDDDGGAHRFSVDPDGVVEPHYLGSRQP